MWPYPRIVAHRGAGRLAPENTLAAMRYAAAHGFRGVEFDVMLAADGIPVLMHDPDFGRTVAGQGRVAGHTAAQLGAMDAGIWLGPEFAGEPVPTLHAVMQYCDSAGIWMNIELKPTPGCEAATGETVARDVAAFRVAAPATAPAVGSASGGGDAIAVPAPLLSSFSPEALRGARRAAPQLSLGLLCERLPDDWQRLCASLGVVSIHLNQKHLTAETASAVRQGGYGLFCYTVNEPERAAALLAWGVDGFCTDRLDLIGPAFAPMPGAYDT